MSYGYGIKTLREVMNSDQSKIGVKLGVACINRNISVMEVAKKFGVSRATVYGWFIGIRSPREPMSKDVEAYIKELTEVD